MNKYLKRALTGEPLTEAEMIKTVSYILDGKSSNDDLAPLLTTLSERGETIDEITGAARVLRERAITIKSPTGTIDCCGTGGDKSSSYNISTAVSFVLAACGVPVAKHGNRASTSRSGAADILEMLGVNLNMPNAALEQAIKTFNFAFLLAPRHHPDMKHVAVVRKKIGKPTIFNLVGPLANPANVKRQLVGVYSRKWLVPMASALQKLGSEKAWVVHGSDGLDEITITGETYVAKLENDQITETTLCPEDFGLKTQKADSLEGGSPNDNATALRALLEGKKGQYRDIVLVNAAAALNIHGSAKDLKDGVKKAADAIDKGIALQTMKDYVVFSREHVDTKTK